MYENFTVFTNHAALHWLLTIDDPSGRLIRWRLRRAEYYFEVKYKKGKINSQEDSFSRLNNAAETILHDDRYDIPVFSLDPVQMKNETNSNIYFMELQYSEQDSIISTHEPESDAQLYPIELEEVTTSNSPTPSASKYAAKPCHCLSLSII